jgi:hypothetical protein
MPRSLTNVFERFTEGARKVLVLAQEEARLLGHSFIGTEHLLLGILHEHDGIGAHALDALGITLETVREQVGESLGSSSAPVSGSVPFSPQAKRALELALRESLQLGDGFIGTEHLLLGLVRDPASASAEIVVDLSVDLDEVRREVRGRLSDRAQPAEGGLSTTFPPAAREAQWSAPAWDRPSEGTLPAVLPVNALVLRNDRVAVAIDRLEVYPNGFTINLAVVPDPRGATEILERLRVSGPDRWPSVEVRFSDGRTTAREPSDRFGAVLETDEEGLPTRPYLRAGMTRGAGHRGVRSWAWVFPLPPEGPIEILVALRAAGLGEAKLTLEGREVRKAAERATILWT